MDLIDHIPPVIRIELVRLGCDVTPCGSQAVCDPPPGDKSDYDFLVVVPSPVNSATTHKITSDLVTFLVDHSFAHEGGEHYQVQIAGDFMSFRRLCSSDGASNQSINLIVTSHQWFAERHKLATFVCRRLNVMNKEHRKTIFQAVLYANAWTEEPERPMMVKASDFVEVNGAF